MKPKCENKKVIHYSDWNEFIYSIYKLPYNYQQQNDCQNKSIEISIPRDILDNWDDGADSIPYEVNGEEMCVKFDTWKNSDFKEMCKHFDGEWRARLFYERNFYPDINPLLDDLYKRGLLEEGEYLILVD